MYDDEARQLVVDAVVVRRQQVALMKALLLRHYNENPTTMLEIAVKQVGAARPQAIVLHPSVDTLPALQQFAEWIAWWVAGCEGLWGLVHRNLLLPVTAATDIFHPRIEWTTIVSGSGGHRAAWDFPEFKLCYPNWVTRSRVIGVSEILCDPDLFLHELNLPDLHPEVESALREAVSCFHAELYPAAIVMLGKASEGTWIELGLALLSVLPPEEATKRDKLQQQWNGPDVGFSKKMRDIMKVVETRQDLFKNVGNLANVRLDELRMAMIWSDSLRDARNVVHHNVETNIDATFEMVSTLFLAALSNLKILNRLTSAAARFGNGG